MRHALRRVPNIGGIEGRDRRPMLPRCGKGAGPCTNSGFPRGFPLASVYNSGTSRPGSTSPSDRGLRACGRCITSLCAPFSAFGRGWWGEAPRGAWSALGLRPFRQWAGRGSSFTLAVRYLRPRASTRLKALSVMRPKSYITPGVMTRPAVRRAFSRSVLLAIATGPRRWYVPECDRMCILSHGARSFRIGVRCADAQGTVDVVARVVDPV